MSNSKCEQKHLMIYALKQPVLIALSEVRDMQRYHMPPKGRDAAFAEDVQEVTRWPSSPMLLLTSPLVSRHLLAHTLPAILWRFPRKTLI